MTLTPREYLHQHFGPKDRRWIESLSDDRAMDICEEISRIDAKQRGMAFTSYRELAKISPLPNSGEYPNWR